MKIRCAGCGGEKVKARLTRGSEVYPYRRDLAQLPFWKCDACGNWVGCHHKTGNPTRPLGVIPTPELRRARQHIHRLIDPVWKRGDIERRRLYALLSDQLGWKYHTAAIRDIHEARRVYVVARNIIRENT